MNKVYLDEFNFTKALHIICKEPADVFNTFKDWAKKKNFSDFSARHLFGRDYFEEGRFEDGKESGYEGFIFLFAHDIGDSKEVMEFKDSGLYAGIDMVKQGDGQDIGANLRYSSELLAEYLNKTGKYDIDMPSRNYYEEHLYPVEWYEGKDDCPAQIRLWIPIRTKE